jgi:hypothetical protein
MSQVPLFLVVGVRYKQNVPGCASQILPVRAGPQVKVSSEAAAISLNAGVADIIPLNSAPRLWLYRGRVSHLCAIIAGLMLGVAPIEMPIPVGTLASLAV